MKKSFFIVTIFPWVATGTFLWVKLRASKSDSHHFLAGVGGCGAQVISAHGFRRIIRGRNATGYLSHRCETAIVVSDLRSRIPKRWQTFSKSGDYCRKHNHPNRKDKHEHNAGWPKHNVGKNWRDNWRRFGIDCRFIFQFQEEEINRIIVWTGSIRQ